ncbi:aspartic proteinase CDR1-like, partial [Rosa rugosa]|uniref:aspartic proteinase CDR1-like n=1 Tax=Rosa rugosa TaxID=74645 RepID=UPI002B40C0D6
SGKVEETALIFSGGEYLMNISIGKLSRPFNGIVDIGSDLIWTQCTPCKDCFKQKIPLFDLTSSLTYKALSCASKKCHLLTKTSCSSTQFCHYNYTYRDGSYTTGNLSLDTVTLNSLSVPDTIFSCGHQNGGIFSGVKSEIFGLGSGDVSFVSQIGKSVGGKYFSHCLVPTMSTQTDPNISSKMYFDRKVSGAGVVSTPLFSNGSKTFYYLELQGISVGGNRFTLAAKLLRAMLSSTLTKLDITSVIVTVHFSGADVKLKPNNIFLRVCEDIVCLAFGPTTDLGIYENVVVTNFLVGYDLENNILSFKPTDCTS